MLPSSLNMEASCLITQYGFHALGDMEQLYFTFSGQHTEPAIHFGDQKHSEAAFPVLVNSQSTSRGDPYREASQPVLPKFRQLHAATRPNALMDLNGHVLGALTSL
eukprot:jgi/Botrbrau1/9790/Bobra.85_1s0034.1